MIHKFTISVFLFLLNSMLFAQHSVPSTLKPLEIEKEIDFDGVLDESVWQEATHISNFTQRDLNYGEPVSEKTEVAVLYDKNTLYIGVWCYYDDPSVIVAKNMNVDFQYWTDDNFQVMLSTFDDNRTGYLFVINPNGARADIQVYGGEDGNYNWNGVWDTKTTINNKGWFAEIEIPFSTMQFRNDSVLNWALNFERDIVSKNEQALWQGWSRDYTIYSVANAGRLTNIRGISYAKKFEFKPYVLSGWQQDSEDGDSYPLKVGGNLNISITPTMKLNLTSYTDFAQVESDRIPVNLSRFSVYYPEKRQFFLEGYDMFSYYLGGGNDAFYSRQLGVEDDQQVSIIAGARMFGKVGRNNIGFLNIQEGKSDSTSTTNNTVFRYKRDFGKQSYVGCIFTNKISKNTSNQVLGADVSYQSSKFMGDKNIVVAGEVTTTTEDFKYQGNAMNYRFYVDYPNDLIDNYIGVSGMGKDFNPELGFLRRSDYESYDWHFRIMPRVFTKFGIKRLLLKPWSFSLYRTHSTGEIETFYNETRPLGAVFQSGERFEVNFQQIYDRIDTPFDLTDNISVPVGKYTMYKYELQFETYEARRVWTGIKYKWGDFYTGSIKTVETWLGVNVNMHFNVNCEYTLNSVDLPEGNFATNEIALYMNYAFTTKVNASLFSQYNDLDDVMIYNFRLHWIPKVGSDFYFVYNLEYLEPIKQIDYLKPTTTGAVAKLVYRFVF